MDIVLKELHKQDDEPYVSCLRQWLEEHNPFCVFTTAYDYPYAMHKWIEKQYQYHQAHRDHTIFWICAGEQVVGIVTMK